MLKFVKYATATTSLTRHLVAAVSTMNVKGDELSGVPTLFEAKNYCTSMIDECIGTNDKYKNHNTLKVVEEPGGVYIEITAASSLKKTKLCGFVNEEKVPTQQEKLPVGTRVKILSGKYANRTGYIDRYPYYAGAAYIRLDKSGREKTQKTELILASMGGDRELSDKHLLDMLEVLDNPTYSAIPKPNIVMGTPELTIESSTTQNIETMTKQSAELKKDGLGIENLPLNKITGDPNQPRIFFNVQDLEELAKSIVNVGVIEPILVRPMTGGYMIVFGERRFRASLMAQDIDETITTIPCMVKQLSDKDVLELQITENLQRSNPHPMEEAASLEKARATYTVSELAARYGKTEKFIAGRLLLNNLIEDFQLMFFNEKLTMKEAIALARLTQDNQQMVLSQITRGESNWQKNPDFQPYNVAMYASKAEKQLSKATFDTEDANLNKKMGACSSCMYNSANNLTLFVKDTEGNVCSNAACYEIKTSRAYEKSLEKELANPDTIFIAPSWVYEDSDKKKVETAKRMGATVVSGGYDTIEPSEQPTFQNVKDDFDPELEMEDYDEDNPPSPEEIDRAIMAKLVELTKEWEEETAQEQADLEKAKEEGTYRKAFVLAGNGVGEYKDIILRDGKIAANTDPKGKSIEVLIAEVQQRETRAKELDGEKVWLQVKELAEQEKFEMLKIDTPLADVEHKALAVAIYGSLDYRQRDYFLEEVFNQTRYHHVAPMKIVEMFENITPAQVNILQRLLIASKLFPGISSHLVSYDNYFGKKVTELYYAKEVLDIELEQAAKADKRMANVNKRIAEIKQGK